MRFTFWVTALAVLSIAWAKNSTTKTKPKRQLENIRTPQNLQYSLVLPHSRVAHFRSLSSNRRISHAPTKGGKLPPYAVQMEPVVQYSQKDPLYDPNLENLDDTVVNKNEIYAQSKILNTQDHDQLSDNFGPPYGSLPTAPLYSQEPHSHYYETPEPIIEIIIKESNESLPAPPPPPVQKKKKEPVHVFYVKYSKDPHSKDKVVYEKPIPAITPSTNDEDDHHDEYVTVTPQPYIPPKTTTLRAIIKPESEVYHSESSVKVTFGNEGRHYSGRREGSAQSEDREETAPRPAIAFPNQPPKQSIPPIDRSVSSKPQYHESSTRSTIYHTSSQTYRSGPQHAQSRIQFQPQYLPSEQQLPRQGPSTAPFKAQSHISHQPFGPTPSFNVNPAFSNGPVGPITHFSGSTVPGQPGPVSSTAFSRTNNGPSFHSRPNNPPFPARPHFNGPPRTSFHPGPQRPFHPPQTQSKPYFDEAKYLQENYHTITTEQVEPPKDQSLPSRQPQTFNQASPSQAPQFQDHFNRNQIIPLNQQLPQQRPPQHFETIHSKPSSINPSSSTFFNLKPSPPKVEDNHPPFQQHQNQQFSFHQGPQPLPGLSAHQTHNQQSFSSSISASPSPVPLSQFLPQATSPSLYNFQPQSSLSSNQQQHFNRQNLPSERPQFQQQRGPSERPQYHQPSERPQFQQSQGPSERPAFQQSNFRDQSNLQHQQNIGQFIPKDGELVPAISKYEQHITVNGPTVQQGFSGQNEPSRPSPTPSHSEQQYHHQQQQYQQQQQQQQQQQYQQQQQQYQQQLQYHDTEQDKVRLQLAQNVQKQQEEIQRLQAQLLQTQQQHHQHQIQAEQYEKNYKDFQINFNQQVQATSPKSQNIQERSRAQASHVTTSSPPYYQSTSRTVEIRPTTQKYVSSTMNSISTTPESKKEENKKKHNIELPDEVPDDLRQQLLSSGILDNADISILDYDKVGETPLDSLPPDQLANFFSAGGAQQIASSEHRPIFVKPNGDQVESRIDEDMDMEEDQDIAASENMPSYVLPPPSHNQTVEMKVVHFDPNTPEGQNIAKGYVKENATQVDPVALNDKKYNRYLPLKVSGNQFPLPDILKGRKVTSVVVLAPVETEALNGDHTRTERATSNTLKGIKFVAGESLQDLLKRPTKDNFEKWLTVEKKTAADLQSIILLVTGNDNPAEEKEIFMYDILSGNVNRLSGELSNAFVEAAENNSLSKDIESLAIEGNGTPESFDKDLKDEIVGEGSENVPLFVDLSGVSLHQDNSNQVSISFGYSKTKLGRSLRKH